MTDQKLYVCECVLTTNHKRYTYSTDLQSCLHNSTDELWSHQKLCQSDAYWASCWFAWG